MMAGELGAAPVDLHPDAIATLLAHPWPGNVRELKNTVERSVYRHLSGEHAAGPVRKIVLDPFTSPWQPVLAGQGVQEGRAPPPDGGYDYKAEVETIERELIADALERNHRNQRATADYLQLTYDQLRGMVRKFGLADNRTERS